MTTLSSKQQDVINKFDITVVKSSDHNGLYIYFVAGVYNQQKGFDTEYDAYSAAIAKVLKK